VFDNREAIGDGLVYPMIWKLEKKQNNHQKLGLLNVMPSLSNSIAIVSTYNPNLFTT
jgi:hypothetical protein